MKIKNKLLSLASLLAISNIHAIEIGPTGSGLELSGFVDLYFQSQSDIETTDVSQVELNLDYASGPVSVSVDFDLYDSSDNGAVLEEAIITYDFGNGFSVTGGKMLSYLGFEAYDPTNMYQYSYAYDADGFLYDSTSAATIEATKGYLGAQDVYDAYDDGVSLDFANDMFSVGIFASVEQDGGYEYAFAFTGIDNLTVKAIMADWDAYEKTTYWASYQMDKLLLAFEIAEKDTIGATADDIDAWLVMGNYAITDSLGLTLRYSEQEVGLSNEFEKVTISPSYVFTDNLSGLIEYSSYDSKVAANEPGDLFAVEVIFTF